MRRLLIFSTVLLAIMAVIGAGYFGYQTVQEPPDLAPQVPVTIAVTQGDVARTVTAPGQLVGTQEMVLGMAVNGRLSQINVRPGSVVQDGEVLAQIDPQPYADALAIAQIQLTQAEITYERQIAEAQLSIENSELGVGQARAQVPALTAAEVQLQAAIDYEARAQNEYNKALDRPWEPAQVVEGYRLELEAATRQRQLAQANYDALLNQQWAVGQEVEARQTAVAQANLADAYLRKQGVDPLLQLTVEQAQADLAATTLVAPFAGVVLAVMARPGETVGPGFGFIVLADPAQAEVQTTVIEEDLSQVQVGQTAEIYFDARPEIAVKGEVARIVPQRIVNEARPLYHVYLSLREPLPENLFPGMTADASITISLRENVLRLPRALLQAKSDGTATVDIWQNGQAVSRQVRVGLRGDVYLEIVDGLAVGDEVVAE
jgi:RND family efflux transporter MFP subunit